MLSLQSVSSCQKYTFNMYFDPISAWLVALLFDGTEIIFEQARGKTVVDDFYRDRIESRNRSLNSDIRRVRAKYELIAPEYTLNLIQRHVCLCKKDIPPQYGVDVICIAQDNQEYIIALLESCVASYYEDEQKALSFNQTNMAGEYRTKIQSYQKVIANVREYQKHQAEKHEATLIKKEKEKQIDNTAKIILIAIAFVITTFFIDNLFLN